MSIDCCLFTVGNDDSAYCVSEKTILSEMGDAYVIRTSDVTMLDSESFADKSVTWSYFVLGMDSIGSIEHERMSSDVGTAKGSNSVY